MPGFDLFDPELKIKKNYFLEASAGTGKTFTIENIVLRLLQEDCEIEEILIVTFTRAATMELKIRIRHNLERLLYHNSHYLLGPNLNRERLCKALVRFDQAQIFTIHGFCFHLLKESALETGFPLHQHEESAAPELLTTLIKDFLRTGINSEEIHPMQLEKILRKCQGSVEKLSGQLMAPILIEGRKYQDIWVELKNALSKFTTLAAIYEKDLIDVAPRFKGLCDRNRKLKVEHQEGIGRFIKLLKGDEVNPVDLPLLKMRPEYLLRKASYPEILEPLNQQVIPLLEELSDPLRIVSRIARRAQEYVTVYKEKEDLFFYDDLLKKMAQEVKNSLFCEKVRAKYKVALIDEFQDTDRLQWQIFSKLFFNHIPLYLIGDPKQSIYRFRGADLYTYRQAKEQFGLENYATLHLNFRSQPDLVEALNTLFCRTKGLISLPQIGEEIPITPVVAALKKTASSGIVFLHAENEEELFDYILEEIERRHIEEAIPYKEFAILVKDRYQAKRVTARCHLPFINKRSESLIESEALTALEDFLLAIYFPREKNRIIKVLGGPLFGFNIDELIHNEEKTNLFFHYHEILLNKGILFLFHCLKERLYFPDRSFYLDFLQLVEILVERASSTEGYLDELHKLKELNEESEILKAHAKCDEDAIQVMTLHVSKGLEFEVVFPVALQAPSDLTDEEECSEKMRQLYVACTRAKRYLYLPVSEQENSAIHFFLSSVLQGESLRSFIENRPYFSLIEIESRHVLKRGANCKTPDPGKIGDFEGNFQNRLAGSCRTGENIPEWVGEEALQKLPSKGRFYKDQEFCNWLRDQKPPLLSSHPPFLGQPMPPQSHYFQPCSIFSFTSLTEKIEPSYPFVNKTEEEMPAGPEVGILLHRIFEKIDFKIDRNRLTAFIMQFLRATELEKWQKTVEELVWNTLQCTLKAPSGSFSLSQIDSDKMIREMEFLYASNQPEGYLKGVVDLFFEHQNQFYIIDWKSNLLENYEKSTLTCAIEAHQYHLQAKIYCEAAQKYLVGILKENRFGGFFYLILRGLNVQQDKGSYFFDAASCK